MRHRLDDSQYGAALLGLSGLVVKAHGAPAEGIQSAIRFAKQGLEHNILDEIRSGIHLVEAAAETESAALKVTVSA